MSNTNLDKTWMIDFLTHFVVTGNIYEACLASGADSRMVRRELRDNPQFKEEFDDAQSDYTDRLEGEATKRAMDGSDMLLERLLKANRPEKFRDTAPIINNNNIKAFVGFSPDDWDDKVEVQLTDELS
jgi:hypothetical protein